jgi:hypothetical protein
MRGEYFAGFVLRFISFQTVHPAGSSKVLDPVFHDSQRSKIIHARAISIST